jgi:phage tail sheath protein FI
MPVTPTYPGVYIEEIPSGVRTIAGVATSVAAFVGWAPKGPTDSAQMALSWSDFDRQFGGLYPGSLLGYAVYHFFANGGQQAYIVRLAAPDAAMATTTIGQLTLTATGPGQWANAYKVEVAPRSDDASRFRLTVLRVTNSIEEPVELFENLSMASDDARFVKSVIDVESLIVNADVAGTNVPPAAKQALAGGLDGTLLKPNDAAFHTALNGDNDTTGVYMLKRVDLFNLLCVPGETDSTTLAMLQKFCRDRRAFLIADCDQNATFAALLAANGPNPALTGKDSINAAFYFPWIKSPDPNLEYRLRAFPPCGFVAGLYAQADVMRGVWKAPAGTEASLTGAAGVTQLLTDKENGELNIRAVNCIRTFPVYGTLIWGARTLDGNSERGSEWKYVPVRRMALFIEESLFRALKWVVFEPNDEPLWARIRLNVGAFMHDQFRKGAFQGSTPRDAYFVKCDKDTTTQTDINLGIVNIVVGFAPLKPAEFVILKIQQMAGQIQA